MYGMSETREENRFRNGLSAFGGEIRAPFRILVADDQEMNRAMVADILHGMGYCPEVVENGRDAVYKWEQSDFDLILMDINMPLIDGVEATWIIRGRERERTGYTPILACSADTPKEDLGDFSCLGFDGFVRKPIDIAALVREIHRCLHFKRPGPA